jgi:hypothetical protein
VLIENKIFAAVVNPFEDYAEYLCSLENESGDYYQDQYKTKILLTLYPSGNDAEWGFVNITHADFEGAVRSRLRHHIFEADTRYLTLMLDFLNTLENLGEGTRMNLGYANPCTSLHRFSCGQRYAEGAQGVLRRNPLRPGAMSDTLYEVADLRLVWVHLLNSYAPRLPLLWVNNQFGARTRTRFHARTDCLEFVLDEPFFAEHPQGCAEWITGWHHNAAFRNGESTLVAHGDHIVIPAP